MEHTAAAAVHVCAQAGTFELSVYTAYRDRVHRCMIMSHADMIMYRGAYRYQISLTWGAMIIWVSCQRVSHAHRPHLRPPASAGSNLEDVAARFSLEHGLNVRGTGIILQALQRKLKAPKLKAQVKVLRLKVRASRIPSLCTRPTRAGIEWCCCHRAVCMARPRYDPHHSGRAVA